MQLEFEEFIINLAEHINHLANDIYDLRGLKPLDEPKFKCEVLDSPSKFTLPGIAPENDAILMVSNKEFPDFVDRAVANSLQAQRILSDQAAAVVLAPIYEGRFINLSYAVWQKHRHLSNFRLFRKIQKNRLETRIYSWLHQVAKDSIVRSLDKSAVDICIRSPLECITANSKLSSSLRRKANQAIQTLDSGHWNPVTILQHSDFWLGNVLLLKTTSRSPVNDYGFCVIDWGGALCNGVPVIDMVRYSISSNVTDQIARSELLKYFDTIQIAPEELPYYLLISLGRIGLNLEQFPEYRYLDSCEKNFAYMQKIGLTI